MYTTTNMGLKVWNLVTDLFSHTQLEGNFTEIDAHDHTTGNGVQIPAGGIANGAVTTAKVASGAITTTQIGTGAVTTTQLGTGAVTTAKVANNAITNAQIANATITATQIANSTITPAQVAYPTGVSASANVTASPGQFILAESGVVVTLPASGTSSVPITVMADAGVSYSSPVTLTTSAGIHGPGIPGTVAPMLGQQWAFLTFQWFPPSGSWLVTGGAQDSGWTPITYLGGHSSTDTGNPVRVRLLGDRILMRGTMQVSSSGIPVGTTFASLPTWGEDVGGFFGAVTAIGGNSGSATFTWLNGELDLYGATLTGGGTATLASGDEVMYDGLSYPLDQANQ